jgi:hypothetical protein
LGLKEAKCDGGDDTRELGGAISSQLNVMSEMSQLLTDGAEGAACGADKLFDEQ